MNKWPQIGFGVLLSLLIIGVCVSLGLFISGPIIGPLYLAPYPDLPDYVIPSIIILILALCLILFFLVWAVRRSYKDTLPIAAKTVPIPTIIILAFAVLLVTLGFNPFMLIL